MLKSIKTLTPAGIYQDYLQGLPQATAFLGPHYRERKVFAETAARVSTAYQGDRAKLVALLLAYNRSIGGSAAAEVQLKKLTNPQSVVVVCGQQAGLLTGPLYTIYKALAAVKLAAQLEGQLARPVVPLFWIASEDHDFLEANHCYLQNSEQQLQKLELPLTPSGEPLGRLPLTAEAKETVIKELNEILPASEFKAELMQWLTAVCQLADTPVSWFARLFSKLFNESGLVLFDPLLAEARQLAAPVLAKAVELRQEIEETLAEREAALVQHGYSLQVQRAPDSTLLMRMDERRAALFFREGHYSTRDGSQTWKEAELLAAARKEPQSVSANVLLRPLVQDTIFPTLATVLGPGETAYFAQALALYPLFGLQQPCLVPRPSVTVLEARLNRYLTRYQVPETALLTDLDSYLQQVLQESSVVDLTAVFAQLKEQLAAAYQEAKSNLRQLNPQLATLAEKNLQHVYQQVAYLENKAQAEQKQQQHVTIRHFAALQEALTPQDKPQDRVLNIVQYLAKYGPDWWQQLQEEFTAAPGHYLYQYEQ
ncbi:MAG TPA: bacillithiol biosynthesis cysteine-adding enzyme BshC [Oscillospiraceae bacterium]|nr:bacillithiol biosynthesis cysteine-adding enzyme BshC [Oscillospiraceae bacterium]